ncbi:MAG: hypothetical protein Kow00121_62820 [Elainellaceae cyanobacterium]
MVQDWMAQNQFTKLNELFVNPITGDDGAEGTQANPYKTLTRALQYQPERLIIRLSAGTYSVETGEQFPLVIPPQTSIFGETISGGTKPGESADRARQTVITGGGFYTSTSFGDQNIALWLGENAQIKGVTITNPLQGGTGVWIETGATIADCQIINCGREGIFVSELANPSIINCVLRGNTASGITFVRYARGTIRRSLHHENGFGLVISDYAAPLIVDSQFTHNRSGMVLSGTARPVLRRTAIEYNQEDGLAVFNQALPDLGNSQDPANNFFRENGNVDLRNATTSSLVSVGNHLMPGRVEGVVDFRASQLDQAEPSVGLRELQTTKKRPSHPKQAAQKLAATKLLPVVTPPASAESVYPRSHFTDLVGTDLVGHWAEPFVQGLEFLELTADATDQVFCPDQPLSRADYATWIVKLLNLSTDAPDPSFGDLSDNHKASMAIAQVCQAGWITGFPDRTFRPEQNLTRLQAIVGLVQGLQLTEGAASVLTLYRDRVQIPSFAVSAVAAATQHRLIVLATHPPDRLNPLAPISRAELAAMLYQVRVYLRQAPVIASPHIVNPNWENASFADIQGHWATDFMRGLASLGSLSGSSQAELNPDRPMTRAEYAVLLDRLFHPSPDRPAKSFPDLPNDEQVRQAIEHVYQGHLMGGFADGSFRPEQPVTRTQVLLALVSQLQCPPASSKLLQRYTDAETIPASAQQAMATATAQWLVVNFPTLTQLHPNRSATCAEVAAMVYQALVRLGQATPIPSPYIIDPRQPQQHQTWRSAPVVVVDPGHGGADLGSIGTVQSGEMLPIPSRLPRSPSVPPLSASGRIPEPISPTPQISTGSPGYFPEWQGMPPVSPGYPEPGARMPDYPQPGGMPKPTAMPAPAPLNQPALREKDIVLPIAQEVATLLQRQGIAVLLTRSTDRLLPLASRVQMAEQVDADLLVSIHANASPENQPDTNGIETYHYPNAPVDARLAQTIHETILQSIDLRDRGVRQANLYLLRSTSIPTALVEVGYLTGREDAMNLANAAYRSEMAAAIANGILRYLEI